MIKLTANGVYYHNGDITTKAESKDVAGYKKTMAYSIISAHNTLEKTEKNAPVCIKFDAIASHDITYVGIIQTAKAIGLEKFPIPYVLTNCHNSLCAVGGTINEDDHIFGLSAAKKYGGIYVPAHIAVIHTYMRERMAGVGKMILGSDSHTRYGAIGTMAMGEGGPELVKQIIGKTYDINYPDVVGIKLTGKLRKGVGPQDVALLLIKAVFASGFVKNKVLEFFGSGISGLSMEYRNGIDVMTTETTCLSSIWATDEATKAYLTAHQRGDEYSKIAPQDGAYYDSLIEIDLDTVEPMIALPFHPSNVYSLAELIANPVEILTKVQEEGRELLGNPDYCLTDKISSDGKIIVDQAIIAGCAGGTYDNLYEASEILDGHSIGDTLSMSVYCGSQPIYLDLMKKGALAKLAEAGANIKTSFCGPCFGAGDVPNNNGLSIRHTTRNFQSREGAKPNEGQVASVCLMDARSIAMTAKNGYLSSAMDSDYNQEVATFTYDDKIYSNRVYQGYNIPDENTALKYGPNIADWPEQIALQDNIAMRVVTVINDAVTTTDELIPSGETSSYRSNPIRLASFTLSRKAPQYVGNAQVALDEEKARQAQGTLPQDISNAIALCGGIEGGIGMGSTIFAVKPGDGSAREQAASCQRVLGGIANIAVEYATKRYRSNLINWGMVPYCYNNAVALQEGDIIIVKNVKDGIISGKQPAHIVRGSEKFDITLTVDSLTDAERDIIFSGCLINYNRKK